MKTATAGGAGGRYVRRTHSGGSGVSRRMVLVVKAHGASSWIQMLIHVLTGMIQTMIVVRNLISWLVPLYLQNLLQFFFEGELTPIDDYKKSIVTIIEEYFSNVDVELAAIEHKDLGADEYHHYFVKKLVSMPMDGHDKEKEMESVLLSALYSDVISSAQIGQGFVLLLKSANDLALDILDAVDIIALFIACVVVDDIVPPAFLIKAKCTLTESSEGLQAIQTAEKSYLSELVERRRGGSTHITVEEVKKKITDLLRIC